MTYSQSAIKKCRYCKVEMTVMNAGLTARKNGGICRPCNTNYYKMRRADSQPIPLKIPRDIWAEFATKAILVDKNPYEIVLELLKTYNPNANKT